VPFLCSCVQNFISGTFQEQNAISLSGRNAVSNRLALLLSCTKVFAPRGPREFLSSDVHGKPLYDQSVLSSYYKVLEFAFGNSISD
jgi:hypothetical protein